MSYQQNHWVIKVLKHKSVLKWLAHSYTNYIFELLIRYNVIEITKIIFLQTQLF